MKEGENVAHDQDQSKTEANIKALDKLRELPRQSNVESRIASIKGLLGDHEVIHALRALRWPRGVVCPRCHSSNIVLLSPPEDAQDNRNHYECLNCKSQGDPSEFDDFTGVSGADNLQSVRQLILCWYLMGFCSLHKVANILGLSLHEVMALADVGTHLTQVPEEVKSALFSFQDKKSKKAFHTKKKEEVEENELKTRSESRGKFKPGPKSSF